MKQEREAFEATFRWIFDFMENFEDRTLTDEEKDRAHELYAEGEDAWEAAARVVEGR
ncbi:hypothetical protein [Methylobacterium aquaticum]|uniref:hypothetical protein n=1 Tax=Methylobacterium aquaticum TaxID=270351 RepID=UPI000AC43799|nr:hypothetical protein [Methylobacterium aquaticum]